MISETYKQSLSVCILKIYISFGEITCAGIFMYLLLSCGNLGKLICIAYVVYFIADFKGPCAGKIYDRLDWRLSTLLWSHMSDYFPMRIVKTCDLPLTDNYILAAFPHGIFSYSSYVNLTPNSEEFHENFSGLRPALCTLHYHFNFPFFRDIHQRLGLLSVSKESIVNILDKRNCYRGVKANAAVIIPGGLNEAQKTTPGQNRVCLKDRKGFVKIAIETGSPLVPVYTFGESELFDRLDETENPCWAIYEKIIKVFFGNRITVSNNFMPKRVPLVTVIGAPIEVVRNENPTQSVVDELHMKFCDALMELFEAHKEDYYGAEFVKHRLIIE